MNWPSPRIRRLVFGISIILNLGVTLPALLILFFSSGIRFYLYEQIAGRVGRTEIVFIGDSITRDGGIWGAKIGRPFFTVRNLAHSGFYTDQVIFQAHSVVSEGAGIAFVMAGINDLPKSPEGADESFEAYTQILDVLRKGGVEPVIQSTLYRENGEDGEFVTRLNDQLRGYALENGIEFLDLNEILAENGKLRADFSRDGTHLTEKAYRAWAEEIRSFLEREN